MVPEARKDMGVTLWEEIRRGQIPVGSCSTGEAAGHKVGSDSSPAIGRTIVLAARVRPKYIGGERAVCDETLKAAPAGIVYKLVTEFTIWPQDSHTLVTIVVYPITCKQQRAKPPALPYTLSFLSLFSLFKKATAAMWEVAAVAFCVFPPVSPGCRIPQGTGSQKRRSSKAPPLLVVGDQKECLCGLT